MLRLRNRFLPLLRAASSLPYPIHPRPCHLLLSTSTSTNLPAPFSLEDYIVASCGLAPAQAREASTKLIREEYLSRGFIGPTNSLVLLPHSRLHSASHPDAILALLSDAGLSRADITAVISADPLLLRADLDKIAPRLLALRDRFGLSTPQIARFLLVASSDLRKGDVAPQVEYFISFFGSFDRVLAFTKRNPGLFHLSFENTKTRIALFRQRGVPDVAKVLFRNPWVINIRTERLKEFLLRAEELGVPAASPLFREALSIVFSIVFPSSVYSSSKDKVAVKLEFLKSTLGCSESEVFVAVSKMPQILRISDATLLRKLEFLKSTLGCSESEVFVAVSKMPQILRISDATLLRKIEFLINEAAMEPQYIVQRPVLLTYSLEKRLVPRHNVMKVLQEKGLLNSKMSFYSLLSNLTEEAFKSKFIDCHKDSVPGLADAYAAASASIVPSRVNGNISF